MTVNQLYEIYNSSKHIVDTNLLANISNRHLDINGYNLINRILIYIQNKHAVGVNSEEWWEHIGRTLNDKASPIWILENVIETKVIDPDTGEELAEGELTPEEVSRAIKLGTLEKVSNITSLKVQPVYNVKDTHLVDEKLYKNSKDANGIRLSNLLVITEKSFELKYARSSNVSYYSKPTMTIMIGNDSNETKVDAICEGLLSVINLPVIISDVGNELGMSIEDMKKLKEVYSSFFVNSMKTLCIPHFNVNDAKYQGIEDIIEKYDMLDEFIQILSTVFSIIEDIVAKLKGYKGEFSNTTLKKAAELLNILEANEAAHLFDN